MSFLHRLLPPAHCLLCRTPVAPEQRLCAGCAAEFNRLNPNRCCQQCALPLTGDAEFCGECLQHPPAFSRAIIPYSYDFPLDYVIGRFKYHSCHISAQVLAQLLRAHLNQYYQRHREQIPDLVVPTPLHWRRRFNRGFNQTEWLARHGARALGLPLATKLLKRHRHTSAQQGLSRKARLSNIRGAFSVPPKLRRQLLGKRVALVDDVVTTATTAREMSRVLMRAGAREVQLWALARTPEHLY